MTARGRDEVQPLYDAAVVDRLRAAARQEAAVALAEAMARLSYTLEARGAVDKRSPASRCLAHALARAVRTRTARPRGGRGEARLSPRWSPAGPPWPG